MKNKNIYDTIIIGAGMAGLSAGIYAARNKMDFLVIAKEFGGQMNVSGEVLNYPGIIETTGSQLMSVMKKQVAFNKFKINEGEEVSSVEKQGDIFEIHTDKNTYKTKTVILATGSKPRKLNIEGEEEFINRGVHYCALCDGPIYGGKDVAIVGGGDSALEAVDFMKKIAHKIYIINIQDNFTAHQYLIDRVKKIDNVEIINNAKTKKIIGDKLVKEIIYIKNNKEVNIKVGGVFVEIGRIPNSDMVKSLVNTDKSGHVEITCQTGTSIPGLFAAGDVTDIYEYQYVISAGQGCAALIKAARYLSSREA